MRIRAVWNGQTLAESDQTIVVEGNHYFPPGSRRQQFFQKSNSHTICAWKGESLLELPRIPDRLANKRITKARWGSQSHLALMKGEDASDSLIQRDEEKSSDDPKNHVAHQAK